MNISWLFETQQKRFLNGKKVKGHWTNLPCILDGAVSGTHPKLYCTISWFRAAFAYVIRHCAFAHTHTLPAHLQIFTLLFYCDCLLRDLCACIEILRVNKVYMQRWTATYALLFLSGLGAFDVFFLLGNKSIVRHVIERHVLWLQKVFEHLRHMHRQKKVLVILNYIIASVTSGMYFGIFFLENSRWV